jgi:hypothetical protein
MKLSESPSMTRNDVAPHAERRFRFPFCAWSVALLLFSDWLLFVVNLLTDLHALPLVVVAGGLAAGISVAVLELLNAGAPMRNAALKGLAGAVLVAAPLPMLGTLLAAFALVWTLAGAVTRRTRPLEALKAH